VETLYENLSSELGILIDNPSETTSLELRSLLSAITNPNHNDAGTANKAFQAKHRKVQDDYFQLELRVRQEHSQAYQTRSTQYEFLRQRMDGIERELRSENMQHYPEVKSELTKRYHMNKGWLEKLEKCKDKIATDEDSDKASIKEFDDLYRTLEIDIIDLDNRVLFYSRGLIDNPENGYARAFDHIDELQKLAKEYPDNKRFKKAMDLAISDYINTTYTYITRDTKEELHHEELHYEQYHSDCHLNLIYVEHSIPSFSRSEKFLKAITDRVAKMISSLSIPLANIASVTTIDERVAKMQDKLAKRQDKKEEHTNKIRKLKGRIKPEPDKSEPEPPSTTPSAK